MGNQNRIVPVKADRSSNRERGFSMIELSMVVLLTMIVAAMAYFQLSPGLQVARSDAAMRELVDQLRQAREYAIVNRRYVKVTFPISAVGQPQVQITQMNALTTSESAGSNVVLGTVPLQSPLAFTLVSGMTDTPDGFGKAGAIEFEGQTTLPLGGLLFQSDGELVDGGSYLPVNGSIFLGIAGNQLSARAVTVLGATGRVRGWRSKGTGWVQF